MTHYGCMRGITIPGTSFWRRIIIPAKEVRLLCRFVTLSLSAKLFRNFREFLECSVGLWTKNSLLNMEVTRYWEQVSIYVRNCSGDDILRTQMKLECGAMPNVMVALPNIGTWHRLRKFRNSIPCTTPQSLADAAAGVPCSNAANIGERKTWT